MPHRPRHSRAARGDGRRESEDDGERGNPASEYLERHGIRSLETDLGEFVVQLGKDHPSHIVKPILHKNRREIAEIFEREGLGPYDDEPKIITRRAREYLRKKYLKADVGITGANSFPPKAVASCSSRTKATRAFASPQRGATSRSSASRRSSPTDRDLACCSICSRARAPGRS